MALWEAARGPTSDKLETFFFLAHGCHAALDAPKKVDAAAVEKATRERLKHTSRLPLVLAEDKGSEEGFSRVDSMFPQDFLLARKNGGQFPSLLKHTYFILFSNRRSNASVLCFGESCRRTCACRLTSHEVGLSRAWACWRIGGVRTGSVPCCFCRISTCACPGTPGTSGGRQNF